MGKELTKELELLRDYNQKGNLEPRLILLIDYIDELEQENFNLREGIYIEKMSFQSEGRNFKELMEMPTYQELQEENNQLKEQYCERTDCSGRLGNSRKVERLIQENKKLHDKIDKAIEYLEEDDNFWILDSYSEDKVKMIQEELLKILKDSDVDE